MNLLLFKTKIGKILKIRLCLPAQEAVPGQTISVALGQHGIKTNEFIKQFNNATLLFPKGILVSIIVIIYQDGSFVFEIKGIESLTLLKNFIDEKTKTIQIRDLCLVVLLLKKSRIFFSGLSFNSCLKSLFGTLKSRKVKILY